MLLMISQFWSVSEVKWFYLVCLSIHDITATNTQLTSNSLLESKDYISSSCQNVIHLPKSLSENQSQVHNRTSWTTVTVTLTTCIQTILSNTHQIEGYLLMEVLDAQEVPMQQSDHLCNLGSVKITM